MGLVCEPWGIGIRGGTYHGLWKRYVEIRNRTMNAGEAEVGIKRRGSQLQRDEYT